jgi:ribonuclease J
VFLGGLSAIGRNCLAIEDRGRILVVDCGVMFPTADTPGIDLILPDLTWLHERSDRIDGCVATHAHFDHIGAFPYLLAERSLPVFGSRFTLRLLADRLNEDGVEAPLVVVDDGERRMVGSFDCEFLPITHSIPGAMAVIVRTSNGTVLHTGDFKLDPAPTDERTSDIARIREVAASEGIRVLLSDSTNACKSGSAPTEREVREQLRLTFAQHAAARITVVCFASNVFRLQSVIELAAAQGRSIAPMGMSMRRVIDAALETGELSLPPGTTIYDILEVSALPPERVCIISTGSQGDAFTALARASQGRSNLLRLGPGDVVVMSTKAIPGNEEAVAQVENDIVRCGARLVTAEGAPLLHATGHAHRDELLAMVEAAQPTYLVPVHGEPKHLVEHAAIGETVDGVRSVLVSDGDVLALDEDGVGIADGIETPYVYVDAGVVGLDPALLRDRRTMGNGGLLAISLVVDPEARRLVRLAIAPCGWRGLGRDGSRLDDLEEAARATARDALAEEAYDPELIETRVRKRILRLLPRHRPSQLVIAIVPTT